MEMAIPVLQYQVCNPGHARKGGGRFRWLGYHDLIVAMTTSNNQADMRSQKTNRIPGVLMERSFAEFFGADPDRVTHDLMSRRSALRAALGVAIPYAALLPAGLAPIAFADGTASDEVVKDGLRVLNDRPFNAETPAHLLHDEVTPVSARFVRNNGLPPWQGDAASWVLKVDGEACLAPQQFTLAQLRSQFETVTLQLQLACGGNGRAEFRPRVSGNQWSTGAVGCPDWTGVRLKDVLDHCGIAESALYVAYEGADTHLSGDPAKRVISRGAPMRKALEAESLIVFGMNGKPLPPSHGGPLRLVCGGWPGSVSGKWLNRLMVRDVVHDGAKMGGNSYRVPSTPVAPGTDVPDSAMSIIHSMPVKSLITAPRSGVEVAVGKPLIVAGHAWAGDDVVAAVDVTSDFGATWHPAALTQPVNRLAWQHFQGGVSFSKPGYYEIWARARDNLGRSQPMVVPGWNPKGYLNNATHRIAVKAV